MLISLDWIKDFIEEKIETKEDKLSISPKELLNDITLSIAEVEGVEVIGEHWSKIRIARIVGIKRHPEAEKLNLVTFTLSEDNQIVGEVVCGANNVRVDMKVPYAPLGTRFPGGLLLEAKKIRGIVSQGMLCSQTELGMATAEGPSHGLWEMPDDSPLGQTLEEYLHEKNDVIINIDNKSLTHRPDLWGHYGMAREIAAVYRKRGVKLKNCYNKEWEQKQVQQSPITPVLEGESAGLAYYALSINDVKIGPSPAWMAQRLTRVGLRPINNIVDISNYVMLELGIPLHIFDRDLLCGDKIIIRKATVPQNIKTLDGIERQLLPEDTVVADCKRPLVIAGIMGGDESGVKDNTRNILIEVANWKAGAIRRTSARLGLRTDSSQRYEKSLDSKLLMRTMIRTCQLVLELCPEAKVVGKIEMASAGDELNSPPRIIHTSYREINSLLGKEVPKEEIKEILQALEFEVSEVSDVSGVSQISIVVPSFRATKDVECTSCIVEEIGRIVGYNTITPQSPLTPALPVRLSPSKNLERKIQDFMVIQGRSLEIITYPLVGEKLLQQALWPTLNPELILVNALSRDHDRMRPSLIPSLLEAANLNQKSYESFRLFELGRAFTSAFPAAESSEVEKFAQEDYHLGILFFSRTTRPQSPIFLEAVNLVENLFDYIKLKGELVTDNPRLSRPSSMLIPNNWPGKHPQQFYHVMAQGTAVGAINLVNPMVLRSFKIRGEMVIAVINLSTFKDREIKDKVIYKQLPKFPSSIFDCTVIIDGNINVENALQVVRSLKIKELVDCKIADVFTLTSEEKIPGEKTRARAVTLRSVLYHPEKTLSGEFIKETENKIIKKLEQAGFPLKSII
ncbi:MAG: phenylalanine--tRNA ligase subunit beta [Oligoflexia bacterium]|nr:phenylalanine--tRNA ligase subunit beta [Oligoflexia bacterium]